MALVEVKALGLVGKDVSLTTVQVLLQDYVYTPVRKASIDSRSEEGNEGMKVNEEEQVVVVKVLVRKQKPSCHRSNTEDLPQELLDFDQPYQGTVHN